MQKIIKKVLDELSNEKPDLSYMRGLLEGIVVEEIPTYLYSNGSITHSNPLPSIVSPITPMDEGAMLDSIAKNALTKLPPVEME